MPSGQRRSRIGQRSHHAVVVGGGFFGCRMALVLAAKGLRVMLLERESELMARASFANQARVHNGYHYPRSVVTGRSSHVNYGRFTDEYADCLLSGSKSYYAIAKRGSKITAGQFAEFCTRIGAPLFDAPASVTSLFQPDEIEAVFEVTEVAMNSALLRKRLERELRTAGVEIRFETIASCVQQEREGHLNVSLKTGTESATIQTNLVLNCTYARTNDLLARSGVPSVPLKHELAEIALIEVPDALRQMAVTVVDGPFFSATPFPPRGLHALTHVRYTPHYEWHHGASGDEVFDLPTPTPPSNADRMLRDARKFLPALGQARIVDSMWEV
ncbi:MAG: FAD-dependent oxidoreductase, partial [Gemmatimonadaceae bacterium]